MYSLFCSLSIIIKKFLLHDRKILYLSRLMFNNLTNLTKILTGRNTLQQILFHSSRSTSSIKIFSLQYKKPWVIQTSKFEWMLDKIRIKKIWPTIFFSLEVSALLDVRHCLKLQSCAILRKYNDATLRKLQKP